MKPVLEVKGLTRDFGGLRALNELDLTVNEGEIVALIGPNGAGKTTFFNCVTGIYKPTEGTVHLYGANGEKHLLNGRKRFFEALGNDSLCKAEIKLLLSTSDICADINIVKSLFKNIAGLVARHARIIVRCEVGIVDLKQKLLLLARFEQVCFSE